MKRLNFLLGSVSGLAVVANTDHLFAKALAQAPLSGLPGGNDRVLILLNLQGGNDGLNTVVPHANQRYYQMRPNLAIGPNAVLRIDDQLGFNPMMKSFKAMYDKGDVAIVQGVGYPNPDLSHFRSTEIWQTASPDRYLHSGWMGRYLDSANLPANNLFNGVALSQLVPEALSAANVDVPAIANLGSYGLTINGNSGTRNAYSSLVRDRTVPFKSPYLARVMEIEDHAQRGSQELPKLIAGYKTEASYPATAIGRSLALAAQIVGSNLGTKVIYVQHGSFDTHINQAATHDILIQQFSDAVAAFYADLAAHGNDKRVLTMTFSEFGRRAAENGSRGTDHGEASPLFLIGGGVKGGIYGDNPVIGQEAFGNVKYTIDFRNVYATILERWLNRPSVPILSGTFPTLPVLG
ncbi:MAG TPA: DUF1501 domain-containing protein [Candidatus Acidoferrales bacterium]|nr:DUF1501 domain-containing protein [Candidatus Acidoferrales bacterium]